MTANTHHNPSELLATSENQTSGETSMQKQPELLVAAGTTVHYDQDVRAERIINHGSITLAAGVTLEANELINEGSITPESGDLKLQCGTVQGDGTFLSGSAIHVTSDGSDGLTVNGGIFDCPVVHFKAKNDANIHANEITGAITLSAKNVAVGVKTGDLNIIEQNVEADPLYYSHSGSISFGGDNDNLSNVDFVAVAARSINGGAVRISGTGRVLIRAGVTFDLSPSSLEGETSPIADTMLPGGAASHVNIVGFSGFNDSTVNVDSIETETGNIDIQAPADYATIFL